MRRSWLALAPLAAALAVIDVDAPLGAPVLAAAGALLLLAFRRRLPRRLALLALAATLVPIAAALHGRLDDARGGRTPRRQAAGRIAAVQARAARLCAVLDAAAAAVAATERVGDALAGRRDGLSRLFARLEVLRERLPGQPALALHGPDLATVAWAGRVSDLRPYPDFGSRTPRVMVLAGSVHTTLLALAPVRDAAGALIGLASAEFPIAARRHIRNEYLSDFSVLAGGEPGLEIRYVDARAPAAEDVRPLPGAPAAVFEDALLRGPRGEPLAMVRATAAAPPERRRALADRYRPLAALAAAAVFAAWGLAAPRPRRLRTALAATAVRLALLPATLSAGLQSPEAYASPLLGALTRSPVDLFLTAAWLSVLCSLALLQALDTAPRAAAWWRALLAALVALPLLGLIFAWIADTTANTSLDLETFALVPDDPALLLVQLALLLILGSGAALLAAALALGGPAPRGRTSRGLWLAGLGLIAALALRYWPRELLGLPLLPAAVLFGLGVGLATSAAWWRPRLAAAGAGLRAGIALSAMALLSALLYPTLAHYAEKNLRLQIEREQAPLVLRQPQWREYVLAEACRRIDGLELLEAGWSGGLPPLVEELAFGVWSVTDLAAFGFSSAVEVQDPAGRIVSRFALNLPSLPGPSRPLPPRAEWDVHREPLPAASGGGSVLHASRILVHHGEVHGAVHVYVKDDFWNLPFITGRDPYSVLYRTASRAEFGGRRTALLSWDGRGALAFSSVERPPVLEPALAMRIERQPGGLWTTLVVDGRPHHTYMFADSHGIHGLAYPRLGPGPFAADLVEAVAGTTLVGVGVLVAVLLLRTLLGRRSLSLAGLVRGVVERFSRRLFVAFIAVALVPVAVLELAVRSFVVERLRQESEDDALERAAVAKKAVEDFVTLRRDEGPAGGGDVDVDAGLVYIASLMRNDLDLFEGGRLLASSKRELYASGLLLPRVSGAVYRALVLEGRTAVVATERIGGFSYLVVSVPVRLDQAEPGILSIPLALRQREVEAVLKDLDRTIRLASVLFVLAAAALAHSMARRISGPIRQLTRATQRVAQGDLSARVASSSRDELRALVESFNQMAGELDQQRRDLERSNRLAAWAEMARQVAHEVKNPLTPIQLSAEHLRRIYRDPSADFGAALEACTQTILKQVRTLRGMVTEFSAFARPPAAPLEPLDPATVIADAVRPYQAALPPGVSLTCEVAEGVPRVRGDRRLLERALVNLIENALQAVGEAGAITVRLRSRDGRVELEVDDDGPGVDAESRERVFEPFFSTKSSGSGLGLALVKKIAEDHGGGVCLHSEPGRTRVALWLPCAPPATSG